MAKVQDVLYSTLSIRRDILEAATTRRGRAARSLSNDLNLPKYLQVCAMDQSAVVHASAHERFYLYTGNLHVIRTCLQCLFYDRVTVTVHRTDCT